jgi:hypothetical protein
MTAALRTDQALLTYHVISHVVWCASTPSKYSTLDGEPELCCRHTTSEKHVEKRTRLYSIYSSLFIDARSCIRGRGYESSPSQGQPKVPGYRVTQATPKSHSVYAFKFRASIWTRQPRHWHDVRIYSGETL